MRARAVVRSSTCSSRTGYQSGACAKHSLESRSTRRPSASECCADRGVPRPLTRLTLCPAPGDVCAELRPPRPAPRPRIRRDAAKVGYRSPRCLHSARDSVRDACASVAANASRLVGWSLLAAAQRWRGGASCCQRWLLRCEIVQRNRSYYDMRAARNVRTATVECDRCVLLKPVLTTSRYDFLLAYQHSLNGPRGRVLAVSQPKRHALRVRVKLCALAKYRQKRRNCVVRAAPQRDCRASTTRIPSRHQNAWPHQQRGRGAAASGARAREEALHPGRLVLG